MRDVRVRRAASMLINRQTWIEAMYGTRTVHKRRVCRSIFAGTAISPATWPSGWTPRARSWAKARSTSSSTSTEAKKLLSAAGYAKGLKLSHFYSTNAADYTPYNTTLNGMFTEALTTDFRPLDYNTEWREVCQRSLGTGYNGFCYLPVSGFNAENYLRTQYTPEGKAAISGQSIPVLTDLTRKIKTEINAQKQQDDKQAQRQAAMAMPDIVLPGFSFGFQRTNHGWRTTASSPATGFPDASTSITGITLNGGHRPKVGALYGQCNVRIPTLARRSGASIPPQYVERRPRPGCSLGASAPAFASALYTGRSLTAVLTATSVDVGEQ